MAGEKVKEKQCAICNKGISTKNFTRHLIEVHQNLTGLSTRVRATVRTCDSCGKHCGSNYKLVQHVRNCKGQSNAAPLQTTQDRVLEEEDEEIQVSGQGNFEEENEKFQTFNFLCEVRVTRHEGY